MILTYSISAPQQTGYYHIEKPCLSHKLSATAQKIIELDPKFILGESSLFNYDLNDHAVVLSPFFQELLKLLVQIEELDPAALEAKSINELNIVLQKPQGPQGGLLRKEGTERWHLSDNTAKLESRQTFEDLFKRLGFVEPKTTDEPMEVNHCVIFGARVERMEARILKTLKYLQNNLKVNDHLILQGSNRKLVQTEIEYLAPIIEKFHQDQKKYWNEVFSNQESAIEANAFVCLWRSIVPEELQASLEDKLVCIKSTRIGFSYNTNQGHRPTTDTVAEDSIDYFKTNGPQSIFAVVEQPYVRLQDQQRFTVLSKAKQAHLNELIERINKIAFHFAVCSPATNPLISVILDEIARNVFRVVEVLKYVDNCV